MNPEDGANVAGGATPAARNPTPRWNATDVEVRRCNLATASVSNDEVILNFGAKAEDFGGEIVPELLRRLVVSPSTAKNLRMLLSRAIEDYDRPGRPR